MTVGGRRPVRVVVVEDHPMMVSALATALTRAGHEVVGTAASGAEAYDVVGATSPEAVVVDLGLPDESGIELTRRLLRRRGDLAVVIHTGTEDAVTLKDALECGARGVAYKTGGVESLLTALSAAAAGGTYIAPELTSALRRTASPDAERRLSDREREVLTLVAEGNTNEEIADRLALSAETVRTHIRNAMRKLGAHSRAHAIVIALRNEEIAL